MPYSSFSLLQVQRQFALKVIEGVFFTKELIIEAPGIILIEAKKGELNAGWGQCAAEMVAAQQFNRAGGQEVSTIYGSVTTGTQWQFLKLTGQDLTIDVTEYPLNPIVGGRVTFAFCNSLPEVIESLVFSSGWSMVMKRNCNYLGWNQNSSSC